jgi:hypothetical protein
MLFFTWQAWLRRVRQNLTHRSGRVGRRPRLEWLEDRTLPSAATFAESDGGKQLNLGLVTNQQLSVVSLGTSYTFTLASGDTWSGTADANVTTSNNVLTVTAAGIGAYTSGIVVGDGGSTGGDSVSFLDSGTKSYTNELFITLGHSASPGLSFSGNSTLSGLTNDFQTLGEIEVNTGAFVGANSIQLTTTGPSADILVNGTIQAASEVDLTSTGSVSQSAPIQALALAADAAAGVALTNGSNSVADFTATDTASGDIALTTGSGVSVGGITQSGGGAVSVLSTGSNTSLTVNGDVTTAGGRVTLQATGNVTLAADEKVSSGTGAVTLAADVTAAGAGDDGVGALTVGAGALVTSVSPSAGAITLRGAGVSIDPTATVGEPSGPTTPSSTLTGLTSPQALAFDGAGNLYVANAVGTTNDTVSVFAPGSTTPTATLDGLDDPVALAFHGGDLYVANAGNNTVSVFASLANGASPSATLDGLDGPAALAFSPGGDLFVANYGATGVGTTVSEFTSLTNGAVPSATLGGLSTPIALAFDASGHLFVANAAGTTVSEFTSLTNGASPSSTLTGLSTPVALAFDPSGHLFVANVGDDTVSEFDPGATTAAATLTGLNGPQSLAIDASGNVYVGNGGNGTVSRFTPGATAPSTTFTGLNTVAALAFDAGGNLYAVNQGNGTVSKFTVPGQAGGVAIRSSVGSRPMLVGGSNSSPVAGINLSSTELGRIATIPGGTVTFGDSSQTGNITFAGAVTATSLGATTLVEQSPSGAGEIVLDASGGVALDGNGGTVSLSPGTGEVVGDLSATNALLSSNGFTASGLTLTPSLGFAPTAGEQVPLVSDTGSPISGAFSGLTQGATKTLSYNGTNYTFYVSTDGGSGNDLVLIYGTPPAVTTPPANQAVNAGATATFTAAASGIPTPTVQWQVSTDGVTFTPISGATSTTLTLTGVTVGMNGEKVEAVFTNSIGTVTSTAATLTVDYTPSVTTQPTDQAATAGGTATFTAAADGRPSPSVQWEVNTGGGFTNVPGATSTTLTLADVTAAMNGNEYEAVFTNTVGSVTSTAAQLTVNTLPVVTTQPTNQSTTVGGTATFTAAASGNPAPTVQWEVNTGGGFTNVPGATSTTLTLTGVTQAMSGNQYEAVFTNSAGSTASNAALLSVRFPVTITGNPTNQTVTAGGAATFTASASGNPTPSVRWEVNTGGGTFSNVPGATSTTLTLTGVTASMNGYQYEAVFNNGGADVPTTAATLTVDYAPTVTVPPVGQTVTAGGTATFTASADGNPAPSVQWEVSTGGGFTDVPGATSTTLTLTGVTAAMNGNQYEAVFTNTAGSVTSTAAALTVDYAPVVTTPPANQTATAGGTAMFSAAADANPSASVQWKVNTGGGFTDVPGATSTTLTLTAVTAAMNGNQYEAVFTNTVGSTTSTAAALTVDYAPVVTTPPANQTATAGGTATFSAAADANPSASVQWEVNTGGGFTNVPGATSATLTLTGVTAAMNGNQYEAVFTNTVGSTTSSAATLTVNSGPAVTTQPADQSVTVGNAATFTAAASGQPTPTVQWKVSTGGGFTNVPGATSTTLTLGGVTAAMNGYQYEAVFTNSFGTATSSAATLTVGYAPSVATQPADQTVTAGGTATFTAAASGNPTPTVQWEVNTGGGFSNVPGATSTTLTLADVTSAMNGYQYEAVFTNTIGSATSFPASLTVNYPPTVTHQPAGQTDGVGGSATFMAAADANPSASVQWQVSTDNGHSFNDLPGAVFGTLTLTGVTAAMSGNEYEAVFTNNLGQATSSEATLTVTSLPTVTPSTAALPATAGTLTIQGTGFDPVAANDTVMFSGGVTGTVTAATTTTLSVTGLSQLTGGPLDASVTVDGVSSGTAVEVAAVTPVLTAGTAALPANLTTLTLTGDGFDTNAANDSVSFGGGVTGVVTAATATQLTVASLTGLVGGPLSASVLVNNESSGAAAQVASVTPVVTAAATPLAANAHTLTIDGFGFSPTPSSDVVTFAGGATGTVTAATTTQLSVTGVTGLTAGALDASVSVNAVSSGAAVQVAVVAPVLTASTAALPASATTLTIAGAGFDTNPANDKVTFGGGATGTVLSATATQLTIAALSGLVAGPLTASALVDGVSSGNPVEVAAVTPVVTASTATLPATSTTLTISGFGFDTNAANDVVTFSGGTTGTVTSATNTTLTVTDLAGLAVGPLLASVTVDGVSGSTPVQVATVASVITPSTAPVPASATTLVISGFAFDPTPTHDVVTLSGGATGMVTAATATQLTLTGVSGLVAGPLYASLTVDGVGSGPAVQVAVVTPVVTVNTATLLNNATSLVITGFGFSTTPADNIVVFSGGATGVVTAATLTQLTVTSLAGSVPANGLPLGALTAVVTANGVGSGTAVEVADVVQDAVSPAQTTVAVTPAAITAGMPATVTLVARDASGLVVPGAQAVAFGLGAGTAGGTFGSVTTTGDGTFTATFTGGKAGTNTITATVGGVAVTSAAPTITVSQGPVDLAQSSLTVSPTTILPDGQALVTLTARDAYGNQEPTGGLTVTFGLGSGVGGGTFGATTDNGDGTYSATFTATNAGGNTVVGFINGQPLTSSSPTFNIPSGPAGAVPTDLPLFTWLPVAGASSYTLYVVDQTVPSQPPLFVGGLTGTSYRLAAQQALAPTHSYAWYVGADVNGSLEWSGPTAFTVALPTQTAPARGAVIPAAAGYDLPTFTWTPFADALSYTVAVVDVATGQVVFNTNVGDATSYQVPAGQALAPGHSYMWFLGLNTHTGLTYTAGDPFSLALPQISPAANSTIPTGGSYDQPTFTWAPVTGASSYSLFVQDKTTGQVDVYQSVGDVTSYTATAAQALTPGHNFVWYVGATVNGTLTYYGPQAFALALPQLSPSANATIAPANGFETPTFTWAVVPGATSYSLFVQDRTTGQVDVYQSVGDVTSYTATAAQALTPGHNFVWYVGATVNATLSYFGPEPFSVALVQESPAANTTIAPTAGYDLPTFTWAPVTGATGYTLYLQDTTTHQVLVNLNVGTATSYKPSPALALTPGHSFVWYIEAAVNGALSYFGPQAFSLALPQLSPSANTTIPASAGYDLPTFTWAPVTGAASYSLFVQDKTTGQVDVYQAVGDVTSYTVTSSQALKPGDTFVWYVGATVNGTLSYYGPQAFALALPQLSPSANVTIPATAGYDQPTFTWAPVTGASSYSLFVQDRTTGQVDVYQSVGDVTSYTATAAQALTPGHNFVWYVGATVNGTLSYYGPQAFALAALPGPTPTGPANDNTLATSGDDRPTFTWAAVPAAAGYELFLEDATTQTPLFNLNVGDVTSYQLTAAQALTPGHTYTWYIGARSTDGALAYTGPQAFAVAVPQLSPSANTTIPAAAGYDTPTFTWAAVTGASSYSLFVQDRTTGQVDVYQSVGDVTSYTVTSSQALTPGHNFVWYVGATVNGTLSYYGPQAFALAPGQLTPANASTIPEGPGYLTPTFTWVGVAAATGYEVYLLDTTTNQLVANLNVGNVTSYTPAAALTAGHHYTWYVGVLTSTGVVYDGPDTFTLAP